MNDAKTPSDKILVTAVAVVIATGLGAAALLMLRSLAISYEHIPVDQRTALATVFLATSFQNLPPTPLVATAIPSGIISATTGLLSLIRTATNPTKRLPLLDFALPWALTAFTTTAVLFQYQSTQPIAITLIVATTAIGYIAITVAWTTDKLFAKARRRRIAKQTNPLASGE